MFRPKLRSAPCSDGFSSLVTEEESRKNSMEIFVFLSFEPMHAGSMVRRPWVGPLASSCMHFRTPHWTLDIQKMRQAQQEEEEEEADFLVVCFAHHGLGFIGFIESCALSCMPHRTMLRPMKGLATSRHWFVLAYVHYIALDCPLGQASDGRSRGGSMEVSCPHAHTPCRRVA